VGLVVFTGGTDVTPAMYEATPHASTCSNISRDIEEYDLYKLAKRHHIPMVGICRGAQFICVMAGGKLVQDITGHIGAHLIEGYNPISRVTKDFLVSSSHHQMQYPFSLPEAAYSVLAWTPTPRSKHYAFDADSLIPVEKATNVLKKEPDVVWYPGELALAVQYHPEWMHENTPGFKYFRDVVNFYILPLMSADETDGSRKKTLKTAG
jgi:gamma-glutamyl-gamma-aminobutyrate hydrolase PuuD